MSARTECYLPLSRRGMELRHLSIDPFYAWVAGHRDAVVAVCDEVRVADVVQAHGWQLLAPVEGPIYSLPALPHTRLRGQEELVDSELRPTLPAICSTRTTLRPTRIPPTTPSFFLKSSKQGNPSMAGPFRRRAISRRRNALRRARVKSASTCSSRLMYPTIAKLLPCIPRPRHPSGERGERRSEAGRRERRSSPLPSSPTSAGPGRCARGATSGATARQGHRGGSSRPPRARKVFRNGAEL